MNRWLLVYIFTISFAVVGAYEEDILLRDSFGADDFGYNLESADSDQDGFSTASESEYVGDYDDDFELELQEVGKSLKTVMENRDTSRGASKVYKELKKTEEGREQIIEFKKSEKKEKKVQEALAKSSVLASLPGGAEAQKAVKEVVKLRKAVDSAARTEKKLKKEIKTEQKLIKKRCIDAAAEVSGSKAKEVKKACKEAKKVIKAAKKIAQPKKKGDIEKGLKRLEKETVPAPVAVPDDDSPEPSHDQPSYTERQIDIFKSFPKSYEEYKQLLSDTDDTEMDSGEEIEDEDYGWGRRISTFLKNPVKAVKEAAQKVAPGLVKKVKKISQTAKNVMNNPMFKAVASQIPAVQQIVDKGKNLVKGVKGAGAGYLNGIANVAKTKAGGFVQQFGGAAMRKLSESSTGQFLQRVSRQGNALAQQKVDGAVAQVRRNREKKVAKKRLKPAKKLSPTPKPGQSRR